MDKVQMFDLESQIRAINDDYVNSTTRQSRRLHNITYARSWGRIYFVMNRFLFWTDDGFATINDVPEINRYYEDRPIPQGRQGLIHVIETIDGTILVIAKDWRKTDPSSNSDYSPQENSVVWRMEKGASTFTRTVISTDWVWDTPEGNITSGYFGNQPERMIAFGTYTRIFYYSVDDGLTWQTHNMSDYANNHVHSLYLPRTIDVLPCRLWATTGDDPTGNKGGVLYADTWEDDEIGGWTWAFRERPGYRLVGITGNTKRIFVGNESMAGGILSIGADNTSVAEGLWEYGLCRHRLDFHQFKSMIATDDGYLFTATDSYNTGNTPHRSQGGVIYISPDFGATFSEVQLLADHWVTSATYDGEYFYWVGGRVGPSFNVFRVAKPPMYSKHIPPYVAKSVMVDNGLGNVRLSLLPGESTPVVDMSAWSSIKLSVRTQGPGVLRVQASPFYTDPYWRSQGTDIEGWYDVDVLRFTRPGLQEVVLSPEASHNMLFRVLNSTDEPVLIRHIIWTGKV